MKPLHTSTARSYRISPGHVLRSVAEPYTLQLAELFRAVNPLFLGRLYINYAEMLYQWNDLEKAEAYAAEGLKWARQLSVAADYELIPGWIVMANVLTAKGKLTQAISDVEAEARKLKERGNVRGGTLLQLEAIRLWHRSGEDAPLQEWMRETKLGVGDYLSVFELYDYELYARGLLAEGRLTDAFELLEKLLHLARRELRPIDAAEIAALQACALDRLGQKWQALAKLEEALRTAESNGLLRVLMDEGRWIGGLMAELVQEKQRGDFRGQDAVPLAFVRTVYAGLEGGAEASAAEAQPLTALLTAREMDVLSCLVDHRNGKEIAERLQISYETLKTHRSNIYSKLGAKNREEALRLAAEFGGWKR
nr:LuxR C-terminal-related transcriptional regulator [Paenibacillus turpanensis]